MEKIYKNFKKMTLVLESLAVIVYLYYWCVGVRGSFSDLSETLIVITTILNISFFVHDKAKSRNSGN